MTKRDSRFNLPRPLNSTAGYVLLGIVLAFLVNQGMAFALSTNMPIVAVESNSMVPAFYKGDILVLQGVNAEDLLVGDVIVFSTSSSSDTSTTPVVHRIIKINPDGSFQTKGDANSGQLYFEKHILEEQIYGKSILTVPYLGWVKIGITEYVVPNILWIGIAAIIAYIVAIKATKSFKTPHVQHL